MERANDRVLNGYSEKHHIVPKCMGGDNKPRNIAILTPEEHYLAHQLLVKIYPKNGKLAYAAQAMTMGNNGLRGTCKVYGWLRRKISIRMSEDKMGDKNPNFGKPAWNKGKKMESPAWNKGKKSKTPAWNKGVSMSNEQRQSISDTSKGKIVSFETKRKISEANKGKIVSSETKRKMSEAAKLRQYKINNKL